MDTPTIFSIIVISLLYKAVLHNTKDMERAIVYSQGQRPEKTNEFSFAEDCILLVLAEVVIIFLLWGLFLCCLGHQKNSQLVKIKENGIRVTAKVVSCERNEEYSSKNLPIYSYHLVFELNGEKKKSATMSLVYAEVGSYIDIYYLSYSQGSLNAGAAIADAVESPGWAKISQGIIRLYVALLLFFIRVIVKNRILQSKVSGIEQSFNWDEYQKQNIFVKAWKGDRQAVRLILAVVFSVWCIVSISLGCYDNAKVYRIKEHGTRVTATVMRSEQEETYYRGAVLQSDYFVEFVVDGKTVTGKARSKEFFVRGNNIDIYYIMDAGKEIQDVAIADVDDKPGRNKIYYGILELLIAIGVSIDFIQNNIKLNRCK